MQTFENDDDESSIDSVVRNNNEDDPTDIYFWSRNIMTDKIMTIWLNIGERLCHKYYFVEFLISPNLTMVKEAPENKTDSHE